MYGNQPDVAGSFLTVFIDVYQIWLISYLITILPDLVPFLIRVNKFMEITRCGSFLTVFIDVYQTLLISYLITILPDLVPFLIMVKQMYGNQPDEGHF